MKNLLLLSLIILSFSGIQAQTFTVTISSGDVLCSGATFYVNATDSDNIGGDNVFTAQLSNASGSFGNPDTIGSIAFPFPTGVTVTIPLNTPSGTGYRIRMTSSDPPAISSDNGYNITINTTPTAPTLSASGSGCLGKDSLTLTGAISPTELTWYQNGNTVASSVAYAVDGTVAGGNGEGTNANQFYDPSKVFVDDSGNIYVTDQLNNRIQKFPPGSSSLTNGVTVAGGIDAGSELNQLNDPGGIFVDANGYLYVADVFNGRVIRFPPGSDSTTNGVIVALDNKVYQFDPNTVFVDNAGNLYVGANQNGIVLKYPPNSTASTVGTVIAQGGSGGLDNFDGISAIAVDKTGNLYICDQGYSVIWKFPAGSNDSTSGTIIAGQIGVGNNASSLNQPEGLYLDTNDNVFVADAGNNRIQEFLAGSISGSNAITVAGGNGQGSAANQLSNPTDVFLDGIGNIYIADAGNNRIQKWGVGNGISNYYFPTGTGGYEATYMSPAGCISLSSDTVIINPVLAPSVRITASQTAICATLVDTFNAYPVNGGPEPLYQWYKDGTATGISSNYIASVTTNDSVWAVMTSDLVCISPDTATSPVINLASSPAPGIYLAGSGCLAGDTIYATGAISATQLNWYLDNSLVQTNYGSNYALLGLAAGSDSFGGSQFYDPPNMYVDANGDIYIADENNSRILKYPAGSDSSTVGVTVAGGNGQGFGDNQIDPTGVFVDTKGYIYVVDETHILRFPPGSDSTTIGVNVADMDQYGEPDLNPTAVYVDSSGNIYVADNFNSCIYKFPAGSDSITIPTIAAGGNGVGNNADQLDDPIAIWFDAGGNMYVSDNQNDRIQKFPAGSNTNTNGVTVAGGNGYGSKGNQLDYAAGIFIDAQGNMYVADANNNRILEFPPGSTSATYGVTIVGGNGGFGSPSILNSPFSVLLDRKNYMYILDAGNNRVLKYYKQVDTFYLPADTGTYTANYINGDCSSPMSNALKVNSLLSASVSISLTQGAQPVCSQAQLTFTANAGNGGSFPVYEFEINGSSVQNGIDSTFTQSGFFNGDTIACIMISNSTCVTNDTALSNNVVLNVLPAITPIITQLGSDTLTTGTFSNYQWLNYGDAINNTDLQTLPVTQSGVYSVVVIDTNGCSDTSAAYSLILNGINQVNTGNINLYPNPTTGAFTLETTNNIHQPFTIYDMLGNKVWQDMITADKQVVELKGLTAGSYMVRVGNGISSIPIVIQK